MTQDTRKDRRVKIVSLNVRYKSATVDEFIENHAHDVSRGGIFIKTANPFPPGTLLKFEIRLSSDQAVIAGVGRIVWKRDAGASNGERPAGMGVKFIKIDEPSRVVIDKLMNTRADAGKSFETHDDTTDSDRPPPRTPAPPRPPVSASPPPAAPPKASGTRSISPGADMPGSSKGSGPKAIRTPAGTPLARKATMIGLGASSAPGPISSPPGASPGSASPAKRTPFPVAPTVPPRPAAGGVMFPKTEGQKDGPEKQELTVMKQAAELLEEALREAGGSMEEIGTNPLFSGQGGDALDATPPVTPAREWTTADTPQALAATAAASRAAAASQRPANRTSEPPRAPAEPPKSGRPDLAVARASSPGPAAKKAGSGPFILVGVAAVAILAGIVLFREELFGGGAPPETAVARPPVPTASTTTATASSPSLATAPATPEALPVASAAAASSGTIQPPAATTVSSVTATSAAPSAKAVAQVAASPPVAVPPPRPKPVARPVPTPAASASTTPPTDVASATPSPTEAPTASAKAAAPPPKARPAKPVDDNPY